MFLSLSFFLPSPLSKNKLKNKIAEDYIRSALSDYLAQKSANFSPGPYLAHHLVFFLYLGAKNGFYIFKWFKKLIGE